MDVLFHHILRTVVPAAPDACLQALERWGTMSFRDVAARAIRCAEEGFLRHQVMIDYVRSYADDYRQFPDNMAIWLPGGAVPALGTRLVQADLARTLRFLCDEERAAGDDRMTGLAAVRRAFYRGDVAATILAHQRANGGLLEADDMASFRCQVQPSLARRYRLGGRNVEIHTCGAWCQGPTLHQALTIAQMPGEWIMPFGTPGGDTQVQANLQVLLAHLEFGMDIQSAIEAPRLITHSHPNSFAPHRASPGRVTVESRVDEAITDALAARGHAVERIEPWTHAVAGVCAVRRDLASGVIEGAADPRRTSRALGF
jgi:gamma-glutamyltranspeptidase/glutathione hydrolase